MNRSGEELGYSGARVLITGGLGFIGSNLARRLADLGAEIVLMDSLNPEFGGNPFNISGIEERVRIAIADLRDEAAVDRLVEKQDYIFNLAGQVSHLLSMRDPYLDLDINARSQLLLLEACRQHNAGVKIVFTGTRQIYGRPRYLPVDENHPLDPIDINAVNKLAAERYHILYHRVYGLRTVCLRMSNVYGPRMRVKDNLKTFIGWWIRQLMEGEEISIFGDGQQIRDLIFIEDIVDALLLSAARPEAEGQIYNLGGSQPIRLLDLAQMLIDINRGGRYQMLPFPPERKSIDIGDYSTNFSKFQTQLGWQPSTPLREGLVKSLQFYRQHKEHYW